ncbi:MAG: hypothetical protein ABI591_32910 [Kofleriaceae bacterium]
MKRVALALLAVTGSASADSKTKELAQGYTKELAACHTRSDGVTKVTTGAQSLVDGGDAQYAPDLDQLKAGRAQVQAYCGELDVTLALIADPNASYKALEHQLDEHDNKIRKLRQSSKLALDGLAPVIGKLIPVINARAGTADAPVKKTPIKFASGRSIDAPALPGTWKVSGSATNDVVEYTEGKASATISVRAVDGTCADRKKELAKSAVDATSRAKLVWYVAYDKDARRIHSGCRAAKTGSLIATLDEPVAASWPALEPVLLAMLATRDDK